jgi:hypothetical protein
MAVASEGPLAYDILETMELALNLVWLCVAIAGFALLFVTVSASAPSDRPHSHWRKIVAMSCTLVILFFVISMTDDLHEQEMVVEDSKTLRVASVASSAFHTCQPSAERHLSFLLPALAWSLPDLLALRRPVTASKVFFAAAIRWEVPSDRAPPASFA